MSLAEPQYSVVPFSGPLVRLDYPRPSSPAAEPEAVGRSGIIQKFKRSDAMLRNALYIVLNSGTQAALGFAFWILTTRFFSTADVGRASSLISATALLSFLGLLGMNTAFIRYLPVVANRNRLITAGVLLVAACSGLAGIIYVLITPRIAPSVAFVAHNLPMAACFVVLTAASGVNILTDSIFIAAGKGSYNAIVDGVIGGSSRIILLLLLAGGSAFAIFTASSIGYAAAAVASLLIMLRVLRWRPSVSNFWQVIKPVIRFSGANYVGNVLNLLPSLVVPLIVLNRMSATTEAYYYVAFQLASLLFTATAAVEQSFLAEGSSNGTIDKAVLVRSLRILLAFCVPAFVMILLFGHFALLAFGTKYAANASGSLIALSATVLPLAAYNWFLTVLRLSNRLTPIVWSNAVYGAIIIGLAWALAPHGLSAVSLSWPIGASAGAIIAGVPAISSIRRNHRAA
jgi:O-antigen/teichoic acid export membrane protein